MVFDVLLKSWQGSSTFGIADIVGWCGASCLYLAHGSAQSVFKYHITICVCSQAFSLDRTSGFTDEMRTRASSVPFFVKNQDEFEQKHPIGKRDR